MYIPYNNPETDLQHLEVTILSNFIKELFVLILYTQFWIHCKIGGQTLKYF